MKQTVNRVLRSSLLRASRPTTPKRFVVKPFDTAITSEQWKTWAETKIEETLSKAESSSTR